MLQIADLINDIHKDVELERQGITRMRRWTGDTSLFSGNRGYQARAHQIRNTNSNLGEINQMVETQPLREAFNSIITRFSNLLSSRRHLIGSKN